MLDRTICWYLMCSMNFSGGIPPSQLSVVPQGVFVETSSDKMAAVGVGLRDSCGDLWIFKIRLERFLAILPFWSSPG